MSRFGASQNIMPRKVLCPVPVESRLPTTTDDIACVEQRQPWLIGLNKNCAQKTIDATNYGNVIYHAAGNTQPGAAIFEDWHCVGVLPDWIGIEVKLMYDVAVPLGCVRRDTRVASVRAAWR